MKRLKLYYITSLLFGGFLLTSISYSQQNVKLEIGHTITKDISKGDVHVYEVFLYKGDFLFAVLKQQDIDLGITAKDSKNNYFGEFDIQKGRSGDEPILLNAPKDGKYLLAVKPFFLSEIGDGSYSIELIKIEKEATSNEEKVNQLFSYWTMGNTPGAAVGIIHGDKIFKKGYGLANLEHNVPISSSTIFDIASVSKQFGAMAIAILVDQGLISLDDNVRKYIPELPDFGRIITIRHLVHHVSGIRDWPGTLSLAGWRMDDVITFNQILRMAYEQKELNFEPGTEYTYSNTGYNLLAEIVSRITGQSFLEWTDEKIFLPLHMTSSHFRDDHQNVINNLANGYYSTSRGYKIPTNGLMALGSSSLYTSVDDLIKWVKNFDSGIVGGKEVFDRMHTRGILNSGDTIAYAFGNNIGSYRGLRTVTHSGSWLGYRSFLIRFPEQRFAIIILSNTSGFNTSDMANKIASIYLKDQLNEEKVTQSIKSAPKTLRLQPKQMQSFIGRYELSPTSVLNVAIDDNKLSISKRKGDKTTLEPIANNEFMFPDLQSSICFIMKGDSVSHAAIIEKSDTVIALKKLPDFDPGSVDLSEFTGEYYSPELKTSYVLDVNDSVLIARHFRHDEIGLVPLKEDVFTGTASFFGLVNFQRADAGQITGFRVSGGVRVRNVKFDKVEKKDTPLGLTHAITTKGKYISWREHRIDDTELSNVSISGSDGLVTGDLDNDGFFDIVSVHESDTRKDDEPNGMIRIAFGTGDPDQWINITLAEGLNVAAVEDAVITDLNGDGYLDIVAACEEAHLIYLENPTKEIRTSTWHSIIPSVSKGRGGFIRVFSADFNGDGQAEIVAANKGKLNAVEPKPISWFSVSGPPLEDSSWEEHELVRVLVPINSETVDLDGDGDIDIVGGGRGENLLFWFENVSGNEVEFKKHAINIDGTFVPKKDRSVKDKENGKALASGFNMDYADLNGDGRLDIVLTEAWKYLVWIEQPKVHSQNWILHRIGTFDPDQIVGLCLADINDDQLTDVMCGGYSRGPRNKDGEVNLNDPLGRLAWFENPGSDDGKWKRHEISRRKRGMFDKFIARDMDTDGDVDFIATRGNSFPYDGVFWMEQVRSSEPKVSFLRSRVSESEEMPAP